MLCNYAICEQSHKINGFRVHEFRMLWFKTSAKTSERSEGFYLQIWQNWCNYSTLFSCTSVVRKIKKCDYLQCGKKLDWCWNYVSCKYHIICEEDSNNYMWLITIQIKDCMQLHVWIADMVHILEWLIYCFYCNLMCESGCSWHLW